MSQLAPLMSIGARDIISGNFGSTVPVRRAQAGSGTRSLSSEDLSSISSCHSNIDNIAPPSMLEDLNMENSMVSVASISSEVDGLARSGPSGSSHSDDMSLTSGMS